MRTRVRACSRARTRRYHEATTSNNARLTEEPTATITAADNAAAAAAAAAAPEAAASDAKPKPRVLRKRSARDDDDDDVDDKTATSMPARAPASSERVVAFHRRLRAFADDEPSVPLAAALPHINSASVDEQLSWRARMCVCVVTFAQTVRD
jgi:hypothetical protein